METRVYAIEETEDVHEISNDDFMNQAEDLGYVWSLLGFQNELNCEGDPTLDINCFEKLHFRFIDVQTSAENSEDFKIKNELSHLKWLRKFASYISNNANDVYNDASKFADCNCGDGNE